MQGDVSFSMIYFIHVPKTAGTSMRSLFTNTIDPAAIRYVYLPPSGIDLDELFALPKPVVDKLDLLFGHFHYGIDARLGRPGKYLTCLRETASRLVSNYRQHVRGGFVGDLSLLDYFHAWKPKDMDNYTVRLLAGVGHSLPFGCITEDHLNLAKKNLDHGFLSFGLYEYLDESIERFRRKLSLGRVEVKSENVTPPAQQAQPIPANEIAAVLRHNVLDQQLYAYAERQFLCG